VSVWVRKNISRSNSRLVRLTGSPLTVTDRAAGETVMSPTVMSSGGTPAGGGARRSTDRTRRGEFAGAERLGEVVVGAGLPAPRSGRPPRRVPSRGSPEPCSRRAGAGCGTASGRPGRASSRRAPRRRCAPNRAASGPRCRCARSRRRGRSRSRYRRTTSRTDGVVVGNQHPRHNQRLALRRRDLRRCHGFVTVDSPAFGCRLA